ncbi:alpha/beta hydrolase [Flavobacterium sp.]|uniref:alpha/beta hydrolase n=1 Tax=Flavobacterium sp. TaxID=239 RepID=UPI00286E936D|nr:alpha/beta hydrolase [Flavobacterium sp.]
MKTNLLTNKKFILLLLYMISVNINAQNQEISLWSTAIPGAINSESYKEIPVLENGIVTGVSKVVTPTLTVFVPENRNGTAIVICPGGGYAYLAINKEGFKVAKWLNTLGITAFVLKNRLPSDEIMTDKTIGPLQDAQEAMRYVRRNAGKWSINAGKVGIMGFSAGGHLASTLSTHYKDEVYKVTDTISARPDFSILIYPVISMDEKITHKGSRNNLLGTKPSDALIEKYSNEKQIEAATPPTYIVHAVDDKTVPVENSINYFLALKNNKVPCEIHFYEKGSHGFGLGNNGTSKNWTIQCEEWLRFKNYVTVISSPKK